MTSEELKTAFVAAIMLMIVMVGVIVGTSIDHNYELKKQQIISETELRKAEIEKNGEYLEREEK